MKHPRAVMTSGCLLLLAAAAGCGTDSSPEEVCEGLAEDARAERTAARAQADGACTADQDCALAPLHLSCVDGGGCNPAAMSQDAKLGFDTQLRSIEADLCSEFNERRCRNLNKCGPPDDEPVAVCRMGRCEVEYRPLE